MLYVVAAVNAAAVAADLSVCKAVTVAGKRFVKWTIILHAVIQVGKTYYS